MTDLPTREEMEAARLELEEALRESRDDLGEIVELRPGPLLVLQPGDRLVVSFRDPLSLDLASEIGAKLESLFGDLDVVVLDGADLYVVRTGEEE